MLFDIKAISPVLDQFEEEKGISRETMIEAIEQALATAYKKEYGKKGQVVRAHLDMNTGSTTFEQIKTVVDETTVRMDDDGEDDEEEVTVMGEDGEEVIIPRYDPERHMLFQAARLVKKNVQIGDELVFPLEEYEDFGRIAAQAAKQVIFQKVREAERGIALKDFSEREGDIVIGEVERFDRGNLFVNLGRVTAIMPYGEQIPGERYKTGDKIRALILSVEDTPRGISIKLSRANPQFLARVFTLEVPELQNNTVVIKGISREAGYRSKIAVEAEDPSVDPIGALVGQRGARVSAVTSELRGERVDIIEWSDDPIELIEAALSPAEIENIEIVEEYEEGQIHGHVVVTVLPEQQSLAIGKNGQNVRLAAKLTNWKIDIEADDTALADEINTDDAEELEEELEDAGGIVDAEDYEA